MAQQRRKQHSQRHQNRSPRRNAEESQPRANGDELCDQRQKIADPQVDHREPSPERPEPLEDQLRMSTMRRRAQPHRHFLDHQRHPKRQHHEREEESNSELRARRRVRQHAGPIVLAQHHQNARPDQQPQQPRPRPQATAQPRRRHSRPIVRAIDVLVRDDNVVLRRNHAQLPSGLCVCTHPRSIRAFFWSDGRRSRNSARQNARRSTAANLPSVLRLRTVCKL